MIPILSFILILLLASYLCGEIFKKIGFPRVVGQIISGLIIGVGPLRSYLLTPENLDILSFLGNLGAVLLFYYVGLETNFKVFKRNIKVSALISIFNTLIPLLLGFLLCRFLLGLDLIACAIIGACLAVSAQSVSVDLLEELGMLKSKIGSMIISAGAVDDTIEMLIITTLLALLHFSANKIDMLRFFMGVGLFIMIIMLFRIWLMPFALRFFDSGRTQTARFTGSLIIVLMIASISEFLGLGALIGAMIAGMIVRQTIFKDMEIPDWEEHQMASSIHLFAFGFLIPLFFIWVGTKANITSIATDYPFILIISAIAIAGTVFGTIIAVLLSKGSWRDGLILGWGLTPKGDVELIMASTALAAGVISSSIFSSIVIMSLVTTIISPIVFKRLVVSYRPSGKLAP